MPRIQREHGGPAELHHHLAALADEAFTPSDAPERRLGDGFGARFRGRQPTLPDDQSFHARPKLPIPYKAVYALCSVSRG